MKKIYAFLMANAITLSAMASAVNGTYLGESSYSFAFGTGEGDATAITITDNDDEAGTVTVVFASDYWGTYTYHAASVAIQAGACSIEANEMQAIASPMTGATSEYEGTFSATLSDAGLTATNVIAMGGMGNVTSTFSQSNASLLARRYMGTSSYSFAFGTGDGDLTSVLLSANPNGTVNVTFESDYWGTYQYDSVAVVEAEGAYTLDAVQMQAIASPMTGATSEYEGTFSATIQNGVLSCTNVIAMGGMGNVTSTFLESAASIISGKYFGLSDYSFAFGTSSDDVTVINVDANPNGTVNVTFASDYWGTYQYDSVAVSEAEGIYSLSAVQMQAIASPMTGATSEYEGTFTATVQNHKMSATNVIAMGGMGNVTSTFNQSVYTELDRLEGASDTEATAIYSLDGRRLDQLQKGINIVGGKKILVK